jgi:uncharacterized protein (DUF885 family)
MFKRLSTISFAILAGIASLNAETTSSNVLQVLEQSSLHTIRLNNLLGHFFEDLQRTQPEFATYVGKTRQYNGLWTDYSEEGFANRYQLMQKYLGELLSINRTILPIEEQINYDVLERFLNESLEAYHLKARYMPLDHLSGAPLEVEHLPALMPTETLDDYEKFLQKLAGIPLLITQNIALMEKGLEEGLTPPQAALKSLPQRLQNLISAAPEQSLFFKPFREFPESFTQAEKDALKVKAAAIIQESIYPAYEQLLEYLNATYLPNCRQSIGFCALPNGPEFYQYQIKTQTTTNLSPVEIHAMGLAEVARIRSEMESILTECDFQGSVSNFLHFLNTDPQFFYTEKEHLLDGYREIARIIHAKLPLLFRKLPKTPFEIVPISAEAEQNAVAAYYMPGSLETGRPGRFYANTYDLASRPKWQMESLTLHEAIPGHHFQISIAQENTSLSEFRKYTGYTAYIEGWALYAESLGSEIGLYQSPSSKFGRLIEEIWRAVRLVVDTGMHALNWSREESIAYFMFHTGASEREATTEIDRYLVWPGQALAYKTGELSIQKWRKHAQEVLGERFDIRAFHDVLLEQGALPLDVCEKQIQRWIDSQL